MLSWRFQSRCWPDRDGSWQAAGPPPIIGGIDRWTTTTASRSMTRWCAGYRLRLVTSDDFQRGTQSRQRSRMHNSRPEASTTSAHWPCPTITDNPDEWTHSIRHRSCLSTVCRPDCRTGHGCFLRRCSRQPLADLRLVAGSACGDRPRSPTCTAPSAKRWLWPSLLPPGAVRDAVRPEPSAIRLHMARSSFVAADGVSVVNAA